MKQIISLHFLSLELNLETLCPVLNGFKMSSLFQNRCWNFFTQHLVPHTSAILHLFRMFYDHLVHNLQWNIIRTNAFIKQNSDIHMEVIVLVFRLEDLFIWSFGPPVHLSIQFGPDTLCLSLETANIRSWREIKMYLNFKMYLNKGECTRQTKTMCTLISSHSCLESEVKRSTFVSLDSIQLSWCRVGPRFESEDMCYDILETLFMAPGGQLIWKQWEQCI